jgi:hypothetical protein
MNRRVRGLRAAALALLAVGLLGAIPAPGRAAWLGYRNDTKQPVIVQGAMVQGRIVRRGAAHLLYRGDVAWDCILVPGTKIITVYDANNPNKVLWQGPVVVGAADLFFSIQFDKPPPPRKGQRPTPPRIQLVPTKLPTPPPGMRR